VWFDLCDRVDFLCVTGVVLGVQSTHTCCRDLHTWHGRRAGIQGCVGVDQQLRSTRLHVRGTLELVETVGIRISSDSWLLRGSPYSRRQRPCLLERFPAFCFFYGFVQGFQGFAGAMDTEYLSSLSVAAVGAGLLSVHQASTCNCC